eukprot:scaffold87348_cov32-Tisochrysis_lutea.AAC.3
MCRCDVLRLAGAHSVLRRQRCARPRQAHFGCAGIVYRGGSKELLCGRGLLARRRALLSSSRQGLRDDVVEHLRHRCVHSWRLCARLGDGETATRFAGAGGPTGLPVGPRHRCRKSRRSRRRGGAPPARERGEQGGEAWRSQRTGRREREVEGRRRLQKREKEKIRSERGARKRQQREDRYLTVQMI